MDATVRESLLELRGLTRTFGSIRAVDNVSFVVKPGEVLGFLGPNGAGKTTTMRMVTGFLPPSVGTARICGHDIVELPIAAKRKLGYLPEGAPLYPDMTPAGLLNFVAGVRGYRGSDKRTAISRAMARTNLESVLQQPIETLSKGFKRRVGLALAILHEPDVLILDEPTDGLDPNQKHEVRELIRETARAGERGGRAIVLSTHILEEVEAVCTRVVVIARGRIVADCSPSELLSRSKHHNAVTLAVHVPPGTPLAEEFAKLPGVRGLEMGVAVPGRETVEVRCTVLADRHKVIAGEVSNLIQARKWRVDFMRVEAGRLDDVFRELTFGGAAGGGADGVAKRVPEATKEEIVV